MKYEKNDVNELYESINVDPNVYVEIKENEHLTKIKNKWLLINEIVSFVDENPSNYNNNRTA